MQRKETQAFLGVCEIAACRAALVNVDGSLSARLSSAWQSEAADLSISHRNITECKSPYAVSHCLVWKLIVSDDQIERGQTLPRLCKSTKEALAVVTGDCLCSCVDTFLSFHSTRLISSHSYAAVHGPCMQSL